MANTTIQLRRTATAGNIPNPNMMSFGELILNYADGNLFFKAANSAIFRLGGEAAPAFGVVTAGGQSLVASIPGDTLKFISGNNITLTGIAANDSVVVDVSGLGNAAFRNVSTDGLNPGVALVSNNNRWTNTQTMNVTVAGFPTTPLALTNFSAAGNTQVILDMSPSIQLPGVRSAQLVANNNGTNQISLIFKLSNLEVPTEVARITHEGAWSFGNTSSNFGIQGQYLRSRGNNIWPTWNSISISEVTSLASELSAKQNTLVSGTTIKTINGSTVLGSGDLVISGSPGTGNVMSGITSNVLGITVFGDTSGKNIIDSGVILSTTPTENQFQIINAGTLDGNVALCINIAATMTGTNSRLFCVDMVGTEKFAVDPNGNVRAAGAMSLRSYLDIANTNITLPATGNIRLHMATTGGKRPRMASMGSLGRRIEYQEHLADVFKYEIIPTTAVAAPTYVGLGAATAVGTNLVRARSANTFLNSLRRTSWISAGTAAAAAELRSTVLLFLKGNTSANGGFYYSTTIGIAAVPPSQCAMCAFTLTNVTGAYATTSNVTQLRSFIGFGCDRSNSTLKWASSNNSGPANTIELGSSFPVQNNAVYQMKMYSPPFNVDQNVYWSIERLDEPAYAEGVANPSFLPDNGTFLTYHHFMSNGIAAQNAHLDFIGFYAESLS